MGCDCDLITNKCTGKKCKHKDGVPCQSKNDCKVIEGGTIKKSLYDLMNQHQQPVNCREEWKMSSLLNMWENQMAVKYFDTIFKLYGHPYIAKNIKGGFCIWKYDKIPKDDIHLKIVLKDEAIAHDYPSAHYDFLYSHIKVYIPPEKFTAVQNISGSIGYDPLKKELYARCASFEANYATLRTVFNVLNDTKTNYEENLNNSYEEAEDNKKYIKDRMIHNHKEFEEEMKLNCYPGAFPEKCKPPVKMLANKKPIPNVEQIRKN